MSQENAKSPKSGDFFEKRHSTPNLVVKQLGQELESARIVNEKLVEMMEGLLQQAESERNVWRITR